VADGDGDLRGGGGLVTVGGEMGEGEEGRGEGS